MNYTFRINISKSTHKLLSCLGYTAHLQNVNIRRLFFKHPFISISEVYNHTHTHIYLHSYADSSFTQTPHRPRCVHHPFLWGTAITTCIPLSWEMGMLQLGVCLCCSVQTLMLTQGDPLWDHRHPLWGPCLFLTGGTFFPGVTVEGGCSAQFGQGAAVTWWLLATPNQVSTTALLQWLLYSY